MTEPVPTRLDGWKAIAWHFGRDRTTVMRWARDRNLPVRRLPGGGTASVHAFVNELDEWFARAGPDTQPVVEDAAPEPPAAKPRRLLLPLLAGAALLVALVTVPFVWRGGNAPVRAVRTLPADSKVAATYLKARDDWASRTPDGLRRAIAEFGSVVADEPRFAPAYAGLAETYLLAREYGTVAEPEAYAKAEAMARNAIALDPDSADAHRALGFVAFWWRRDIAATRVAFDQALKIDSGNAQTHFWYGNMLVDNGEFDEGLRELNAARLIEPGSVPILADYAFALWTAGQRDAGKAQLKALALKDKGAQSPHTHLSVIHLAEGDYPAYLNESETRAGMRDSPAMVERAAKERAAFEHGGTPALLRLMLARETQPTGQTAPASSAWAAVIAAKLGDRDRLIAILRTAAQRRERWGFVSLVDLAFAPWKNDPDVMRLVAARRSERLRPARATS